MQSWSRRDGISPAEQKQRLTIARALVRHPEILILDDSSSALDFATDARLRQAIRDLAGERTVFIVSQRASTIQYADQILVLDDGAIVGMGRHEDSLRAVRFIRKYIILSSRRRMHNEKAGRTKRKS